MQFIDLAETYMDYMLSTDMDSKKNRNERKKHMRKFECSDELATVVKQFLKEDGWHYTFDEMTGIFQFNLRIRGKIQKINYVIDVHENKIITYGFSLFAVEPKDIEIMGRMAEFICRVNYSMENGCFEMDFTDDVY